MTTSGTSRTLMMATFCHSKIVGGHLFCSITCNKRVMFSQHESNTDTEQVRIPTVLTQHTRDAPVRAVAEGAPRVKVAARVRNRRSSVVRSARRAETSWRYGG